MFPRRHYHVHGFGSLVQMDLGQLTPANDYKYFLVVIDVFSYHIWGAKLKSKKAKPVLMAFKKIVTKMNSKITPKIDKLPHRVESDRGSEFINQYFQAYLKANKISFSRKYGNLKANFAEAAIYSVKNRIGVQMRNLLTNRWDLFFDKVIDNINNSPNQHIGGLKPAQITSPLDNHIIDHKIGINVGPSFNEMVDSQKSYLDNSNNIQPGSFVLLDYAKKAFDKSSKMQRSPEIFVVDSVQAYLDPPMYRLRNLLNKPVPGHWYRQQLRLTTEPRPRQTFRIEKILDTKMETEKEMLLVKFVSYG